MSACKKINSNGLLHFYSSLLETLCVDYLLLCIIQLEVFNLFLMFRRSAKYQEIKYLRLPHLVLVVSQKLSKSVTKVER